MTHALHGGLRQVVVPLDAGPSVRAVEELVDKPQPQVRVAAEVGDLRDPFGGGDVLPHAEGVIVAKAERP